MNDIGDKSNVTCRIYNTKYIAN